MFELGRGFKKLFAGERLRPMADGLTGGDHALLELLDMSMLQAEARSADIAAGRVGAADPALRRLDAAVVWRELARRSGDPVALRKAAAAIWRDRGTTWSARSATANSAAAPMRPNLGWFHRAKASAPLRISSPEPSPPIRNCG